MRSKKATKDESKKAGKRGVRLLATKIRSRNKQKGGKQTSRKANK